MNAADRLRHLVRAEAAVARAGAVEQTAQADWFALLREAVLLLREDVASAAGDIFALREDMANLHQDIVKSVSEIRVEVRQDIGEVRSQVEASVNRGVVNTRVDMAPILEAVHKSKADVSKEIGQIRRAIDFTPILTEIQRVDLAPVMRLLQATNAETKLSFTTVLNEIRENPGRVVANIGHIVKPDADTTSITKEIWRSRPNLDPIIEEVRKSNHEVNALNALAETILREVRASSAQVDFASKTHVDLQPILAEIKAIPKLNLAPLLSAIQAVPSSIDFAPVLAAVREGLAKADSAPVLAAVQSLPSSIVAPILAIFQEGIGKADTAPMLAAIQNIPGSIDLTPILAAVRASIDFAPATTAIRDSVSKAALDLEPSFARLRDEFRSMTASLDIAPVLRAVLNSKAELKAEVQNTRGEMKADLPPLVKSTMSEMLAHVISEMRQLKADNQNRGDLKVDLAPLVREISAIPVRIADVSHAPIVAEIRKTSSKEAICSAMAESLLPLISEIRQLKIDFQNARQDVKIDISPMVREIAAIPARIADASNEPVLAEIRKLNSKSDLCATMAEMLVPVTAEMRQLRQGSSVPAKAQIDFAPVTQAIRLVSEKVDAIDHRLFVQQASSSGSQINMDLSPVVREVRAVLDRMAALDQRLSGPQGRMDLSSLFVEIERSRVEQFEVRGELRHIADKLDFTPVLDTIRSSTRGVTVEMDLTSVSKELQTIEGNIIAQTQAELSMLYRLIQEKSPAEVRVDFAPVIQEIWRSMGQLDLPSILLQIREMDRKGELWKDTKGEERPAVH